MGTLPPACDAGLGPQRAHQGGPGSLSPGWVAQGKGLPTPGGAGAPGEEATLLGWLAGPTPLRVPLPSSHNEAGLRSPAQASRVLSYSSPHVQMLGPGFLGPPGQSGLPARG